MQIAASQTNGGTDSSAAVLDTLDIRRSIAVRAGLWSAVRSSEYKSIISSTVHPFASHAFASDTALGVGVKVLRSRQAVAPLPHEGEEWHRSEVC